MAAIAKPAEPVNDQDERRIRAAVDSPVRLCRYGHTLQSLILGPLYLIVIGIPSTLWGFLPNLHKKRKDEQISYFSFFTEGWANRLGEKVTGEKSMGNLVID